MDKTFLPKRCPSKRWYIPLLLLGLAGAGWISGCASEGAAALEKADDRTGGLRIEFEGAQSFTRNGLLNALAKDLNTLSKDGLDRPDVDDLAYSLEVFYRKRGFPDAFVSYALETRPKKDGKNSRLVARFQIEEGPRTRISSFQLEGNKSDRHGDFSLQRLSPFFSAPSGFFSEEDWWFVEADLNRGATALESYYRSKGYLSAEVSVPELTWVTPDRTEVRVRVTVQQGPLWVLSQTELELVTPLADGRIKSLEKLLRRERRDDDGKPIPYTLRLAYALRARLLERLGEWGHVDATCRLEETELEPGHMLVRYQLDPGPRVRVAAILPEGNKKTRNSFLLGRLALAPGDLVDSLKLGASFSRLFSTGLFRTVSLTLPKSPTEEVDENGEVARNLVVDVLERSSIEVSVEPGYGSYEGPRLRLGLEDSNILGTGRTGEIRTTVGALAQKLSFGLGDRSLFESEFAGSSEAYFDHREEPSFTLQEKGLGLSVSRRWERQALEASLGLRFRRSRVSNVQVVDESVQDALSDLDISSLTLTVARDRRDNFFAPTRGSFARAQFEWASAAFGSEVDFLSGTLEFSGFRPLPWPGAVLGLGIETGLIAPIADTDIIPLQVRKFNGGENTVRSFREDELGNLDANGEPIGGEAFSSITLELRQQVRGPLSSALFYDAGNLEPNHEQYLNFDDMRQAIGVGLRYALPIGPIRLDAGWNPDARDGEDDWVLHFSVGLSF